eukprot:TRINITY_DN9468_c0_g1_i1.p1 TRINITY_DN9468_c0_g1~~TRINITY_DN9468_c0_g1_i1.p1  ORF type:complete len:397 (+),score=69.48 TRINITY_DN9468_c0_g1_i1:61-1191(+)
MAGEAAKLRGHKDSVLCCVVSPDTPHVIVSSSEDGTICLFDLRSNSCIPSSGLGRDSVSSLCFNPGKNNILYAASGKVVIGLDMRMDLSIELEKYAFNKEDINQISFSQKSFLAAADDSGEVKIIDIQQRCLYRTLRSGHTNICSCVQFHPHKAWEVISGGLDSKVIIWDFSRGKPHTIIEPVSDKFDAENPSSSNKLWNPPFVHAIALSENVPQGKNTQCTAVARGDGTVELLDLESEVHTAQMKTKQPVPGTGRSKSKLGKSKHANYKAGYGKDMNGSRTYLHSGLGGHTAPVSCVAFSRFTGNEELVISGGNDATVKIWNWNLQMEANQDTKGPLQLSINNRKKVNWLCTTMRGTQNLIVCDTSKIVKAYTIL